MAYIQTSINSTTAAFFTLLLLSLENMETQTSCHTTPIYSSTNTRDVPDIRFSYRSGQNVKRHRISPWDITYLLYQYNSITAWIS